MVFQAFSIVMVSVSPYINIYCTVEQYAAEDLQMEKKVPTREFMGTLGRPRQKGVFCREKNYVCVAFFGLPHGESAILTTLFQTLACS